MASGTPGRAQGSFKALFGFWEKRNEGGSKAEQKARSQAHTLESSPLQSSAAAFAEENASHAQRGANAEPGQSPSIMDSMKHVLSTGWNQMWEGSPQVPGAKPGERLTRDYSASMQHSRHESVRTESDIFHDAQPADAAMEVSPPDSPPRFAELQANASHPSERNTAIRAEDSSLLALSTSGHGAASVTSPSAFSHRLPPGHLLTRSPSPAHSGPAPSEAPTHATTPTQIGAQDAALNKCEATPATVCFEANSEATPLTQPFGAAPHTAAVSTVPARTQSAHSLERQFQDHDSVLGSTPLCDVEPTINLHTAIPTSFNDDGHDDEASITPTLVLAPRIDAATPPTQVYQGDDAAQQTKSPALRKAGTPPAPLSSAVLKQQTPLQDQQHAACASEPGSARAAPGSDSQRSGGESHRRSQALDFDSDFAALHADADARTSPLAPPQASDDAAPQQGVAQAAEPGVPRSDEHQQGLDMHAGTQEAAKTEDGNDDVRDSGDSVIIHGTPGVPPAMERIVEESSQPPLSPQVHSVTASPAPPAAREHNQQGHTTAAASFDPGAAPPGDPGAVLDTWLEGTLDHHGAPDEPMQGSPLCADVLAAGTAQVSEQMGAPESSIGDARPPLCAAPRRLSSHPLRVSSDVGDEVGLASGARTGAAEAGDADAAASPMVEHGLSLGMGAYSEAGTGDMETEVLEDQCMETMVLDPTTCPAPAAAAATPTAATICTPASSALPASPVSMDIAGGTPEAENVVDRQVPPEVGEGTAQETHPALAMATPDPATITPPTQLLDDGMTMTTPATVLPSREGNEPLLTPSNSNLLSTPDTEPTEVFLARLQVTKDQINAAKAAMPTLSQFKADFGAPELAHERSGPDTPASVVSCARSGSAADGGGAVDVMPIIAEGAPGPLGMAHDEGASDGARSKRSSEKAGAPSVSHGGATGARLAEDLDATGGITTQAPNVSQANVASSPPAEEGHHRVDAHDGVAARDCDGTPATGEAVALGFAGPCSADEAALKSRHDPSAAAAEEVHMDTTADEAAQALRAHLAACRRPNNLTDVDVSYEGLESALPSVTSSIANLIVGSVVQNALRDSCTSHARASQSFPATPAGAAPPSPSTVASAHATPAAAAAAAVSQGHSAAASLDGGEDMETDQPGETDRAIEGHDRGERAVHGSTEDLKMPEAADAAEPASVQAQHDASVTQAASGAPEAVEAVRTDDDHVVESPAQDSPFTTAEVGASGAREEQAGAKVSKDGSLCESSPAASLPGVGEGDVAAHKEADTGVLSEAATAADATPTHQVLDESPAIRGARKPAQRAAAAPQQSLAASIRVTDSCAAEVWDMLQWRSAAAKAAVVPRDSFDEGAIDAEEYMRLEAEAMQQTSGKPSVDTTPLSESANAVVPAMETCDSPSIKPPGPATAHPTREADKELNASLAHMQLDGLKSEDMDWLISADGNHDTGFDSCGMDSPPRFTAAAPPRSPTQEQDRPVTPQRKGAAQKRGTGRLGSARAKEQVKSAGPSKGPLTSPLRQNQRPTDTTKHLAHSNIARPATAAARLTHARSGHDPSAHSKLTETRPKTSGSRITKGSQARTPRTTGAVTSTGAYQHAQSGRANTPGGVNLASKRSLNRGTSASLTPNYNPNFRKQPGANTPQPVPANPSPAPKRSRMHPDQHASAGMELDLDSMHDVDDGFDAAMSNAKTHGHGPQSDDATGPLHLQNITWGREISPAVEDRPQGQGGAAAARSQAGAERRNQLRMSLMSMDPSRLSFAEDGIIAVDGDGDDQPFKADIQAVIDALGFNPSASQQQPPAPSPAHPDTQPRGPSHSDLELQHQLSRQQTEHHKQEAASLRRELEALRQQLAAQAALNSGGPNQSGADTELLFESGLDFGEAWKVERKMLQESIAKWKEQYSLENAKVVELTQSKLPRSRNETKAAQDACRALERQLVEAHTSLQAQRSAASQAQQAAKQAATQAQDAAKTYEHLQKQNQQMQSQLTGLYADRADLSEQASAATQQADALRAQLERAKQQLHAKEVTLHAKCQELSELQSQHVRRFGHMSDAESRLRSLEHENRALTHQRDAAQRDAVERTAEVEALHTRLRKMEAELADVTNISNRAMKLLEEQGLRF